MDNRDTILRCLYENWPDEVSMIGDDLVTRIVDDALSGNKTKFRAAQGGNNFDLAPYIDTIINGAGLLVAILGIYVGHKARQQDRQPRDPLDRTEEGPVTEEDLVEMLAKYLEKERKMERSMAIKLARVCIRVSSDGR